MRRLLLLLTVPSVIVGVMVGFFEQSLTEYPTQEAISFFEQSRQGERIGRMLESSGLDIQEVKEDPQKARHFVWSYLLFSLFRYPQAFGMILLVGLVAPRLISFDMRSRAHLLYLSRPLTAAEYVLGKAGVLFVLLLMIATVPALAIYAAGLFLSTNALAVLETWDIPFRILAASVVLILPTTAIALALSSMTRESRYAGFAWFSIWLLGYVAYRTLSTAAAFGDGMPRRGRRHAPILQDEFSNWMYLSPYDLLGYLQRKAFGLLPDDTPLLVPIIAVVLVTIAGYGLAYYRVSRVLKS